MSQSIPPASDEIAGAAAVAASPPSSRRWLLAGHLTAAVFPLGAGMVFYGWRALLAVVLVVGTTAAATAVWRRIGARGAMMHQAHMLWLAVLLSMALPAHLVCSEHPLGVTMWPLLPAAALLLVMVAWFMGGPGGARVHPVLPPLLLLWAIFGSVMAPYYVLERPHVLAGDLLDGPWPPQSMPRTDPWADAAPPVDHQALAVEPAAVALLAYTTASPAAAGQTVDSLLRSWLPPLEDLVLGAQPGAIGGSSAIAVLVGGLLLLYRRLIDVRIPLLVIGSAYLAVLILPVPVVITETGAQWRWLLVSDPGISPAAALTFANYQLLAGPLLFTAIFIATSPTARPLSRIGRALYAVGIGSGTAALQLYVSVLTGAFLAVLTVNLLTAAGAWWRRGG